jgi:nitronate monooxygenase
MLFSDAAGRTSLTRAFTGRLARSLHNDFIEAFTGKESRLPPYPVQAWLTAQFRTAALSAGRTDIISLWSGQAAPLLKHRRAAQLLSWLIADLARMS